MKMEEQSVSLINYVPSFARGFNLMLIHDDTLALIRISSLLQEYSFEVTAVNDASTATSMIYGNEGKFKLIIAKANMPGMDALAFLGVMLEKDIPVILITSGGFDDVTRKALATGSCYFLWEPILSEDLRYIWQHVYHTKANSHKQTQNAVSQGTNCIGKGLQRTKTKQEVHGAQPQPRGQVNGGNGKRKPAADKRGKLTEIKRAVDIDDHTRPADSLIAIQWPVDRVNGKRRRGDNGDELKEKIITVDIDNHTTPAASWNSASAQIDFDDNVWSSDNELVWNDELHGKFIEVVHALGGSDTRPKEILNWLNEPDFTTCQVANDQQVVPSQKYKRRQRFMENGNYDLALPPASTSIPSPPSQGTSLATKDLPAAPSASLNDQSQNQMNYAGTQYYSVSEPDILKLLETPPNPTLPTELTNGTGSSQSLYAIVDEHPVTVPVPAPAAASMDQSGQPPATEFDALLQSLVEDCENLDWFGNGTNPDEVDRYSEMLKTILDGDNPNRPQGVTGPSNGRNIFGWK